MSNKDSTLVLEQTRSTESLTKGNDKPSANEGVENQESGRDHSFTNISLLTAPRPTFRQAFHLRQEKARNQPLTEIKEATLKRLDYEETYDVPLSEALLEFDDGGRGKKRYDLFRTTTYPFIFTRCLSQLASGEDRECNMHFFEIGLRKEIFASARIFDLSRNTFLADVLYGPRTLSNFIEFVGSRPEVFIMLFKQEINQNLKEDPISQLGSLLEPVGLRQIRVESGDGEVCYKLDEARLSLLMAMTHAHFTGPPMVDEPPEVWDDEEPIDWDAAMKTWVRE